MSSFMVFILDKFPTPQSIYMYMYITCDYVIFKLEARVKIYVAILSFGCKIQNSSGKVVSWSKINTWEISFLISYFY